MTERDDAIRDEYRMVLAFDTEHPTTEHPLVGHTVEVAQLLGQGDNTIHARGIGHAG